MICKNNTCRKEIEEPLVLINGDWICPHCKEPLVNTEISFQITKESNDLFKLSELFYFYSIKEQDSTKRNFYITNAVTNCRLAVEQGHPEAYVRLGFYYDKDYIELNRSEIARSQMAYQYYSAVCFSTSNDTDLKIDPGVENVSLTELKKRAATLLLQMLAEFADGELLNKRYNFAENARKIKDTLGIVVERNNNSVSTKQDQFEKIYSALCDSKNKKRAPVFGLFTMVRVADLKKLFTINDEHVFSLIKNEELQLRFFTYKKGSTTKISDEGLFTLSNKKNVNDEIEDLEKQKKEYVILVFFNKKNGHNFLKKKEVSLLEKYLINNPDEYLLTLATNLAYNTFASSRVYYDDDIYYLFDTKSHSVPKALNKLIEN